MGLEEFDLVSVSEAAEILGCTEGRIHQLLRAGTLPGKKLNERAWAINRADIESLAETPQTRGRPRKHGR